MTRAGKGGARTAWWMLAPFLLGFALFTVIPFMATLGTSFTRLQRTSIYGPAEQQFAGLFNYLQALADPAFVSSFGTVLLFGLIQIPTMLVVALVLALLLDSATARFKRFFRLAYFVPYAVPGAIGTIIWLYQYAPGIAPMSQLLRPLGLDPDPLTDTPLLALANISTWAFTGYNMLIMYSSLQAIPSTLYEAARIDGASAWSVARHIKIPAIAPSIVLTAVFSIIGTFQLFTEPVVLKGQVNTIDTSYTPVMAAYNQFGGQNYGLGSAMSVLIVVVIGALSLAFFRFTQKRVAL